MPINRLEALLAGIGDGAQLEELVADLLAREGYNVDPTGTRGPDGRRDALLQRDGEIGILHCSIEERLEGKTKEDAKKAADRPEDFDFFIFGTTQNPAGVKRDRIEEELRDEYEWRSKIFDLQRIRNRLQGNPKNHDLIRAHLHIDPSQALEDPKTEADKFYERRLERLHNREAQYGSIADRDTTPVINGEKWIAENPPILAAHIVPAETFDSSKKRSMDDFPLLPLIGGDRGSTEKYGRYIINGRSSEDGETFYNYTCAHEDGWVEAASVRTWAGSEEPKLTTTIGKMAINFVRNTLNWYQEMNTNLPFFVYLTLIDGGEYEMYRNAHHHGLQSRKIGEDELRLGDVKIRSYNEDIPLKLRKSINRLWRQTGSETGSIYFTEKSSERQESTTYDWDPPN